MSVTWTAWPGDTVLLFGPAEVVSTSDPGGLPLNTPWQECTVAELSAEAPTGWANPEGAVVLAAAMVEGSRNHTATEDKAATTAKIKRQGPTASQVVASSLPTNTGSKVSHFCEHFVTARRDESEATRPRLRHVFVALGVSPANSA
jgi:hypothetical protein